MGKKLNIRLIVSDIEGCITPPNRGIMIPSDLTPIAAYCEAARKDKKLPPLVLCTGRQIPYVECVAQLIGAFFPGFPSIVESGAFLYDVARNEVFQNPSLTSDTMIALRQVREEVEQLASRYSAKMEYGKHVCISLNPPPKMTIEQFFEIANSELSPWSHILEITHSMSAVDINPAGIDKAAGIRHLSSYTGISPEEMLGIGDTRGDLPMLKLVGVPVCPSNATNEVHEIAKYIAPYTGSAGVADILQHFTCWG